MGFFGFRFWFWRTRLRFCLRWRITFLCWLVSQAREPLVAVLDVSPPPLVVFQLLCVRCGTRPEIILPLPRSDNQTPPRRLFLPWDDPRLGAELGLGDVVQVPFVVALLGEVDEAQALGQDVEDEPVLLRLIRNAGGWGRAFP
eukprot:COSAG02_NODE_1087_length_14672_cov_189.858437_13_plen_143_part_00